MENTITIENTTVHITGSGSGTIVMIHGWPDTHELWQQQVAFFEQTYTCVSFTLPGFSRDDRGNYSLDDVVQRISDVVDAVSPEEKVILLVHDWGCVFGYEYAMRRPQRVARMIGLDVGDINSEDLQQSLSIAGKLMIFTYQIILAISFICPRVLGDPIARFMAKTLQARSNREHVHAGMSMPYAMRWFGINGGLSELLPMDPPFPFYYAYAMQKPMMFHSPQWLQKLLQNPANTVQAFDCSHWIMVDKAEALNISIDEWLNS